LSRSSAHANADIMAWPLWVNRWHSARTVAKCSGSGFAMNARDHKPQLMSTNPASIAGAQWCFGSRPTMTDIVGRVERKERLEKGL